jgi:integrase
LGGCHFCFRLFTGSEYPFLNASPSTVRQYLCGIQFFYESTLRRDGYTLDLVRPAKRKTLPLVLSQQEVNELLRLVDNPRCRMALKLIYACGLGLKGALHVKVADLDAERGLLWVRQGKGGKDRSVPLAERTLDDLKRYRKRFEPETYLFAGRDKSSPLQECALQRAFKAALAQSGINKPATIRTLSPTGPLRRLKRRKIP